MTTTDLVVRRPEAAGVSNLAKVTGFSDRLIELVKATVCPGASPLEVACFLYNAKRLGLDPMTRQIYWIKYSKDAPGEIVIGINGYRAQAESSGVYAGSDEAEFEYQEGMKPAGAPSKATVTVWKIVAGQRVPFTASVRWDEFYPGDGKVGEQWRKRPHNQLSVRAESHALRKAFPQQTERFEIEPAPVAWEQAATADAGARDDPEKIARDARRYTEIFENDEVDNTRPRATGGRRSSAVSKAPVASPAPASDDERAAAIVEQAHAAAAQRDENVDEIEAARQVEHEGLLM